MSFGFPLLSLIIWLPIFFGLLVLVMGDRNLRMVRWLSLIGSVAGFLVALPLYTEFDISVSTMQFTERLPWFERLNVFYDLGVDGISMPLILLNCFTTPLVVAAGWVVIRERVSQYMGAFLIMSGVINGVFAALDAVLFYTFWEASIIPMFIIIGVWGGPNRIYAALKFFLYTLLGSLMMLVALIYLYFISEGSFSILVYHQLPIPMTAQILIFLAFMLAFAVKVPMWPVHTWLPDAHVEAPTGGSVILAAILLKLGGYGFLRFSLPIAPDASQELAWLLITLSLIAIVYISIVALVQRDMKKLVAYSSVAHMGYVTLGFFLFNNYGIEGGMIQMISHGFISGALFLCIGVMYDRVHSRLIADYGGVANKMPAFAAFFMLFAMANSGMPGTSGFVGEFMVIMGSIQVNFWYGFFAATMLVFGAAYTLWMYKRVVFGPVTNNNVEKMSDLSRREFSIFAILALAVLIVGVYPFPLTEVMHATVDNLLEHVSHSKL